MRVIYDLSELPSVGRRTSRRASVVTIGNFDGVHLAHQHLLRKVLECARATGKTAAAITFDPHPTKILAPKRAPKLLTSLSQKAALIETRGIEALIVLPFTSELASLSPEEFVRTILVEGLRARAVFVGPNFRFGFRHAGNTDRLRKLGQREGFSVEVAPLLAIRGERVSSSRIRELLSEGRVSRAGRLLGRPFSNRGAIVSGRGVGKKQTVPTLNLAPVEDQLPKVGVYVSRTRLSNKVHESVTNVGYKPTFGVHRLTIECFLLNFSGEIKDTEMEVEYLHRLRDEMKFPSPAALREQIQKDVARARRFFRLLKSSREHNPSQLAL